MLIVEHFRKWVSTTNLLSAQSFADEHHRHVLGSLIVALACSKLSCSAVMWVFVSLSIRVF